jgi:hypothetical protein
LFLGATLVITAIVWLMDFVAAGGLNLIYKCFNDVRSSNNKYARTQQQETKWYVLRVVSGKERKV